MNVSVKEFRARMREILDRVDRGDAVTLTSRGVPRARLVPVDDARDESRPGADDLPAFGMWADREDMDDVHAHVRRMREGRFGSS